MGLSLYLYYIYHQLLYIHTQYIRKHVNNFKKFTSIFISIIAETKASKFCSLQKLREVKKCLIG